MGEEARALVTTLLLEEIERILDEAGTSALRSAQHVQNLAEAYAHVLPPGRIVDAFVRAAGRRGVALEFSAT